MSIEREEYTRHPLRALTVGKAGSLTLTAVLLAGNPASAPNIPPPECVMGNSNVIYGVTFSSGPDETSSLLGVNGPQIQEDSWNKLKLVVDTAIANKLPPDGTRFAVSAAVSYDRQDPDTAQQTAVQLTLLASQHLGYAPNSDSETYAGSADGNATFYVVRCPS